MGTDTDGNFAYNYGANPEVLSATKTPDNSNNTSTLMTRMNSKFIEVKLARNLQAKTTANTAALLNPVVCIKQGDIMFFNVVPSAGNYPVYDKNSILNTNPDFDYGPFLNLDQMINV